LATNKIGFLRGIKKGKVKYKQREMGVGLVVCKWKYPADMMGHAVFLNSLDKRKSGEPL